MRIIAFSDSHISSTSNNVEPIIKLCNKIIYNRPDVVVMNGDIFDPWVTSWNDIVKLEQYINLERMINSRVKANLPTIWVKGNHDWLIPGFVLPDAIKTTKYNTPTGGGYGYIFTHGWTFDVIWSALPVHDIAFFIADKTPWLMIPLYNFLFRKKLPSTKKQKAGGPRKLIEQQYDSDAADECMNDWGLHFATIQLRAAQYAHKKKTRVIIGHTHAPTVFNGLMADCGDMLDSFTYIDIIDNKVSLKKI